MQVATYRTPDGDLKGLDYIDGKFSVDELEIPWGHVFQWDEQGVFDWCTPEIAAWAGSLRAYSDRPPIEPRATPTVAPCESRFARLPLWAKALFVLAWPVSIPYAVVRMWKSGKWPVPARAAASIGAAVSMLLLTAVTCSPLATDVPPEQTASPVTASQSTFPESTQSAPPPVASEPVAHPQSVGPEPVVSLVAATVVRIVDGDTAVFRLPDGSEEKVRFIGIDTPESTTQVEIYGNEASAYTAKTLTAGRGVFLEEDVEERDKYDRLLAYVWLAEPSSLEEPEIRQKMFNARLALDGYAQQMTIQPNSKYADYFTAFVAEARNAEKGLWNPALVEAEKPMPLPVPATGKPSPTPSASYIGNRNTKKFHYAYCSSVDQMNPSNKVPLKSRAQAISQGYAPCKRCNP